MYCTLWKFLTCWVLLTLLLMFLVGCAAPKTSLYYPPTQAEVTQAAEKEKIWKMFDTMILWSDVTIK